MISLSNNIWFLIILIIFPISILILLTAGCGKCVWVRDLSEIYNLEDTATLKGICALTILLHHFTNKISYTDFGFIYSVYVKAGYLAVAIFLFISGYGLTYQYNLKGENYIRSFFPKRLFRLYLPFFCATIFVDILQRNSIWQWLWNELTFNSRLESNGIYNATWFMLAILFHSMGFYISVKLSKGQNGYLIGGWLTGIAWIILCLIIGVGSWWYNTALTFALGMTVCAYREKIYQFIKVRYVK